MHRYKLFMIIFQLSLFIQQCLMDSFKEVQFSLIWLSRFGLIMQKNSHSCEMTGKEVA